MSKELELRPVKTAELPTLYNKARDTLAACAKVDECKRWADKSKALASYARQSQDPALFNYARRIALRATQRAGQLLKQVPSGKGANLKKGPEAALTTTRSNAGKRAGMSSRQIKDALRVASVPDKDFERAVESEAPPSVSQLAERGTKKTENKRPAKFAETTQAIAALSRAVEKFSAVPPLEAAKALLASERQRVSKEVKQAITWLTRFSDAL